jgi:hypothetical protein
MKFVKRYLKVIVMVLFILFILGCSDITDPGEGMIPEGSGTYNDPFLVRYLSNIRWICLNSDSWDKHFLQTDNIDASDTEYWDDQWGFITIGNEDKKFSGVYNGQDYHIKNLYIFKRYSTYIGLFGATDRAIIENVRLINIDVTGNSKVGALIGSSTQGYTINCESSGRVIAINDYAGGLLGTNNEGSSVISCSSTCHVEGSNKIGGLIGLHSGDDIWYQSYLGNSYARSIVNGIDDVGGLIGYSSAYIENCYSVGSVHGENGVGGLIGSNGSNVINSYSFSSVQGNQNVGGLLGSNGDIVENSYCSGNITGTFEVGGLIGYNAGSVNASFWDMQVSEMMYSNGGVGLYTHQMQTQSVFTDAGWDFVNEDVNGIQNIWVMTSDINSGFPSLRWQSNE